jgi:hypothetical protein
LNNETNHRLVLHKSYRTSPLTDNSPRAVGRFSVQKPS